MNVLVWFVFIFIFIATSCNKKSYFPNQRSNPTPPSVEAWSLNHWTTREVPVAIFKTNFD